MPKPHPTHRKPNRWHDERKRCIYHITLVCNDRDKVLGRIVGNSAEEAKCEVSPLGLAVSRCINSIPTFGEKRNRELKILACQIMPEHAHFCLFVKKDMDCTLGEIIKGLKQGCNKALRAEIERQGLSELPVSRDGANLASSSCASSALSATIANAPIFHPEKTIRISSPKMLNDHRLFDDDFDRTPLVRKGQLKHMINYVHNNPNHRWLRSHKPEWLLPVRDIEIAGRMYDAIGNVNLLGLPRHQVHCRYKWEKYNDIDARRTHQNDCVVKARSGYALVSPFVSPHEAKVRDFCLEESHSVIVLTDNGFTDFAQCPGGLYDYCVNGQVLVLVPSDWPHIDGKEITRPECVTLNGFAEEIVNEKERTTEQD